jgi:RNA polymerase sigma-70 factor (ECF subfamily)
MEMLAFYLAAIESQEDRDLFTELYNEYKEFMLTVANNILGDPNIAEDIVHDAFVRIIGNMERFNLRICHKTKGLIGIIVNGLAIDEYRRRQRQQDASFLTDMPDEAPAASVDIEEQIIQQEQYEEMKAIIRRLDPIYADVLLLRHDYRFTVKEIAEITGKSEDAIRQRLHRAKMKLRELLAREGQEV